MTTPNSANTELDSRSGWMVAGATFLSTFTVFGVAYSFGAFFGPMSDEFGTDRSRTSLFFALTTFLYFLLGAVAGHVADRRGPRPVLLFGTGVMGVGLLATAEVNSISWGYLTYGLGVGIGVACAYVPMVAAVGGWFDRHRTTALGGAVAGIGVGTLVVVPVAEWLIQNHGWRQTYRVMALGSVILLLIAAVGAKRPPKIPTHEDISPWRRLANADATFWVLFVSIFFVSIALFTPFVFLADYVTTSEIQGNAGWLIGLIGISSVVGRLGLGALGSVASPMRLYQGSFLVLGLSFIIWLLSNNSYSGLMIYAVVLGVAYGGFIALSPAVAAELYGVAGLGASLGALYSAAGFGGLVGPPMIGFVIDRFGYNPGIITALVCGLIGAGLLFSPQTNPRPQAKAARNPPKVGIRPSKLE